MSLVCSNTGQKKEGELSAYAVFNPNNEKLPGTFDASKIEDQFRAGSRLVWCT